MIVEIPIDVWDPARGGAEGYLLQLARGLSRRGHQVRILCLRSNPAFEDEVMVERMTVPRWPRWRRELAFAREAMIRHRADFADVTLAVRHALEADVYQPHGGPFRVAVGASLAGIRPPLLRVLKLAFRHLRPTSRVLLRLDREIFRRSPGLITISLSRKVEEDFRRAYPELQPEYERIYNGVDLEEFHDGDRENRTRALQARFAIPSPGRICLFVGHKFGPKGLLDAIRVLREFSGIHLVVLGSGRPGSFWRAARSLGVSNRLHFAGTTARPREFYAASALLIHPTHHDPCSLTVMESLACGCPVITTTANGAGELITDGREGFVVEPGDISGMARSLKAILADWSRFQDAARKRARDLSFEAHLTRVEEVLQRAAERRAGRRSFWNNPKPEA